MAKSYRTVKRPVKRKGHKMSRYIYVAIFIITLPFFFSGRADASNLPPLPGIDYYNTPGSQYICKGTSVHLDGSNSEDQDEDGESITQWIWKIYKFNGRNWGFVTKVYGEDAYYTFSEFGEYYVDLWVQDDEYTLNDEEDVDWIYVSVCDIGVVINDLNYCIEEDVQVQITCDEYGYLGGTFSWSFVSGPYPPIFYDSDDEDPWFEAEYPGIYEIMVQYTACGVTVFDTTYIYVETDWEPIEVPWECLPTNCDPSTQISIFSDDAGNEYKIICAQSDGTGGLLGCAYRMYYNDVHTSSCIWSPGENWWFYKNTVIPGTGGDILFTKIKHSTVNPQKYDTEGCWGYYCALITTIDCIYGTGGYSIWRRSSSSTDIYSPEHGYVCPGHPGELE